MHACRKDTAVSIGPVTSRALRHFKVEPAAEAERPEPVALVDAVISRISKNRTC